MYSAMHCLKRKTYGRLGEWEEDGLGLSTLRIGNAPGVERAKSRSRYHDGDADVAYTRAPAQDIVFGKDDRAETDPDIASDFGKGREDICEDDIAEGDGSEDAFEDCPAQGSGGRGEKSKKGCQNAAFGGQRVDASCRGRPPTSRRASSRAA